MTAKAKAIADKMREAINAPGLAGENADLRADNARLRAAIQSAIVRIGYDLPSNDQVKATNDILRAALAQKGGE